MRQAIAAEIQKARRRHDLLLAVGIALFVVLWASRSAPRTQDEMATFFEGMFYAVPLMNTVVFPVGMAVLASRIWDMETQGNGCRLLFTLQSRGSLLLSKALLCTLQNALICAAEIAGIFLLARLKGVTQMPDMRQLFWLILCTFGVNEMLLFGQLLLSIRSGTQVVSLAVGMIGSLLGVFAAFLPPVVSYLMPWGYYVPLSGVGMSWDSETRVSTFFELNFNVALLLFTLSLGAVFFALAWRAVEKKEV